MYTALVLAIQLGAVSSTDVAEELTSITETIEAIELDTPRASDRWTAAPATIDVDAGPITERCPMSPMVIERPIQVMVAA